jgi:hypothetical protein
VFDSWNHLTEPENRLGFFTAPIYLKEHYGAFYHAGVSSIFEAEGEYSPTYLGLKINPALKNIISLKAKQLTESGIFPNILKNSFWDDNKSKLEPIGPQVLTLRHLGPGFIIITVLLGLCVLVFVVECTLKGAKKWFGACLACYIVVKFTRMNKML